MKLLNKSADLLRKAVPMMMTAFLLAAPSLTQVNAAVPQDEASIRELIRLSGGNTDNAAIAVKQMIEPMKRALPDVPESFWNQEINKVNLDDIIKVYIPIYAKYYTAEDIKALIAFYKSPVGKKVIAKSPVIAEESMTAAEGWGRKLAQQIEGDLKAQGLLKN